MQAYVAAPDNSCKGVIIGPEKNTSPTEFLDNIYAPDAEVLHARMMKSTNTALITFAGLQVPRYAYYYRAEYRCYIHRPRKEVYIFCLALEHRADVCPTPTKRRCQACGVETPVPEHSCTTQCFHCKGDHQATNPKRPAREQERPNKHCVKKVLEANALAPPPTSPHKGHRPRSRTRSSQSKSREKSLDRALESLNNTPGTTSKTSTTTLGLIHQKNRAASAERPELPPAKKPAPAGQTPPANVNTFPNLYFLHILHPTSYPDKCHGCEVVPTLFHAKLECQRPPARRFANSSPIPTLQDWEAVLRDESPSGQRALVQRVRDTATVAL
ncbi:hypothetical protein HPB51_020260 [Rhipicephalus microplus]|uniref:Tick transposon n=1 Tax=Rhipicephalus microplus TaxID=6941 RepID=A0A9J6EU25_RHIMP|nr:hypothetical protein HPB51_020260 [Rhipicephalus microplus]